MSKKKKSELKPLDAALVNLDKSHRFASNKFMFAKREDKTLGHLADIFGQRLLDSRVRNIEITNKFIPIYAALIKRILVDKYSFRLPAKCEEAIEIETEIVTEEPEAPIESSFVPQYPDQTAKLMTKYCQQEKAARTLWDKFTRDNIKSQLLIATTGAGKTYIAGSIFKNFVEQGWIKKLGSISPWPMVYITKATVVEQTKSVLRDEFGLDVVNNIHVLNIEFLRTAFGKLFVNEQLKVKQGQEYYKYTWNPAIHPIFFWWDECQILARDEATQTQIAQAVSEIEELYGVRVIQFFSSATPFARISEAKTFAISTGLTFKYGLQDVKLTEESWSQFARQVADPADPTEYCEAANKRLMDILEPYVTRIQGIRPQFKAYNSTNRISFQTREEREQYDAAWNEYLDKKAKIEGDAALSAAQSRFMMLAQFTIFRKKAEKIRAPYLAKFAIDRWNEGKAPAIACAFKGTMTAIYKELVNVHGWRREDVSFIWGGSTESMSDKQKLAKRIQESAEMKGILDSLNLNLEDLGIGMSAVKTKTDEDYAFEKAHRLLTQKPEDREAERLRFQRQDSRLLIFSYKVGVGLSAHHEAKYPKARPRAGIFTPVYSEKELIQALGRLPRITSISDTYQIMCYYLGTIEESVAARVQHKLKGMRSVVRIKGEHWEDLVVGKKLEDMEDEHEEIMDGADEALAMIGEYKEEEKD